jgi:TRAP transporter TAXI family solute receptor
VFKSKYFVWLLFLAVAILAFFATAKFIKPAPPKSFTIATGRSDGAYYHFAKIYQQLLKKEKITLNIVTTAGSVEALKLLDEGKVDVAFVQGGTAGKYVKDDKLSSLASIFYEPLWVFYSRKLQNIDYLYDLKGKTISIGENGSGTKALSELLLKENDITPKNTHIKYLSSHDSIKQLKNGKIDALFMVVSPSSSNIKKLLSDEGIKLFSFKRALAYKQKFLFLTDLTLGEGIIDLKQNIPSSDKILLATTCTLVQNNSFNPELMKLLLKIAKKVHSKKTLFADEGFFPNSKFTQIPMNEDAKIYLLKGDSFLEKIFPFRVAVTINRLIIFLIPLITLLLPFFKGILPIYRWRIRYKIYKWYGKLNEIDKNIEFMDLKKVQNSIKKIKELQKEIKEQTNIPLSYMGEYYNLQLHIDLILKKLKNKKIMLEKNNNTV